VARIVDVREQTVRLEAGIRNAVIDFSRMTVSVVAVVSDVVRSGQPVIGFGFNSIGRYGQAGSIRERFAPRLLEADPGLLDGGNGAIDPSRVGDILMGGEKPGGHGERSTAVGAIELAVWDLAAKLEDRPLWSLVAERCGNGGADRDVEVYAAGGYYVPGSDLEDLRDEMRGYLSAGYTHVKMKIGGAPIDDDLKRVEAVLDIVGDGSRLGVDANGRFDLETAITYGDRLAPYGLRWYEEPGDPLDYGLLARLAESYSGTLATGENLFSSQDVRNLVAFGGLNPQGDYLQMDPALSYGVVEFDRMLAELHNGGWSPRRVIPHGGHLMALHLAAGLRLGGNESYPGVFQPFGGFGPRHEVVDGRITVTSEVAGIGLEEKTELRPVLSTLAGYEL
jgi:L-alanine-DL-glutamate epimerase-like enolase superfamily enzyme